MRFHVAKNWELPVVRSGRLFSLAVQGLGLFRQRRRPAFVGLTFGVCLDPVVVLGLPISRFCFPPYMYGETETH